MTATELCLSLVSIPTAAPDPTGPAIAVCGAALEEAGFYRLHIFESAPGIAHALFERPGIDPPLLIDGHLDTVPIGDAARWTADPRGEVRDGAVWGRGAADDKGPLAAALTALQRTPTRRRVLVALMGDEELHMHGVRGLLTHPAVAAATQVLVLEPTDCAPILAHKGNARVRMEVYGQAGHSSRPWEGRNAIDDKRRLLDALEAWFAAGEGRRRVAAFGDEPATLLVTREWTPNDTYNVIPDRADCWLNYRPLPGAADPIGALAEAIRACAVQVGASAQVEIEFAVPPMLTPPTAALARAVAAASGRPGGVVAYGTHGGYYADGRRDVVVFGPGSIATAHREDEHIPIQALEDGAALLSAILQHLDRDSDEV